MLTKTNKKGREKRNSIIGNTYTFNHKTKGTITGTITCKIPNNIHKSLFLLTTKEGKEYLTSFTNSKLIILGLYNPYYTY